MSSLNNEADRPIAVFDLDGTLVDSARDLVATLNKAIATEGLPAISHNHVGDLVGQGALKMIDRAYGFYGKTIEDETRSRLHKIFLELYDDNLANETRPYEGVVETLDALRTDDWIIAVCTNKYEGMSKKLLKFLELDHYFAAICGSDTFPVRKPDPGHLFGTIEMAGGLKRKAVMIGDSVTDIKTAHAANIPVIAVDFGYAHAPVETLNPTKVVSHFREMKATLDELISVEA